MFDYLYKRNVGKGLGLRLQPDKPYASKYPLTLSTMPSAATPVVLGIPWYSNFDSPVRDGLYPRWWIGRSRLGELRGGHAICTKPYDLNDKFVWWRWYDQGFEGACVGFSLSRAMTMLNGERYDARWLYREGQLVDEWSETPPEEGTSVDAGLRVLFTRGHRLWKLKNGVPEVEPEDLLRGVSAYRWATNVDDIHKALKNPVADKLGAIPLLNSWGLAYPHVTWLPDEVADRIIFEEWGEAAILTDR